LNLEFTRHQFFNFIVVIGFSIGAIYDSKQNACDCLVSVVKHYMTGLFGIRIIQRFCPLVPSDRSLNTGAGRGFVKGE
jgi:hypothetical protein